jgi:hypothetical protein
MTATSPFTIVETAGRQSIVLQVPGGVLKFELAGPMTPERAAEITDYLNSVIENVTFQQVEDMEPDLERLNEEQPVSEAVEHV